MLSDLSNNLLAMTALHALSIYLWGLGDYNYCVTFVGRCQFWRLTRPTQSPLFQISEVPGCGMARAAAARRNPGRSR